ncbi:uncharacterized protein V1516DRAFT_667526 [Lipomyces oligophaga]|uniref:uncharacterized protein n=1 Tax=Lipomyces oligophaga TaxID=45792 RepID=UPI0034CFEC52
MVANKAALDCRSQESSEKTRVSFGLATIASVSTSSQNNSTPDRPIVEPSAQPTSSEHSTPKRNSAISTAVTNAGIVTTPTGDRMIPSTVRQDGSIRKEIRIRPGYTPDEDVARYNVAERIKLRQQRLSNRMESTHGNEISGAETPDTSQRSVISTDKIESKSATDTDSKVEELADSITDNLQLQDKPKIKLVSKYADDRPSAELTFKQFKRPGEGNQSLGNTPRSSGGQNGKTNRSHFRSRRFPNHRDDIPTSLAPSDPSN